MVEFTVLDLYHEVSSLNSAFLETEEDWKYWRYFGRETIHDGYCSGVKNAIMQASIIVVLEYLFSGTVFL
jgi:hypothetical protein